MSANSKIEWTQATWNPVAGCSIVSPGCHNCYAMRTAARLEAMGQEKYAGTTKKANGKTLWTGKVNLDEEALKLPLRTKKPTMYFVNSMSDLFHESVSDEFIDRVFAVMNATQYKLPIPADLNAKPWHTYQVLTKRAERMYRYVESRSKWRDVDTNPIFAAGRGKSGVLKGYGADVMNAGAMLQWPFPNVWLGVSAEDQQRADERIPWLLKTPAAVRFVSAEPLLGPIDLPLRCEKCGYAHIDQQTHGDHRLCNGSIPGISWVIVGGESGHGARPCNVEWVRSIVQQCGAAGVACFVKQLGSAPHDRPGLVSEGSPAFVSAFQEINPQLKQWRGGGDDGGARIAFQLKHKKGGDPDEWPEDLRVRQMPETAHA